MGTVSREAAANNCNKRVEGVKQKQHLERTPARLARPLRDLPTIRVALLYAARRFTPNAQPMLRKCFEFNPVQRIHVHEAWRRLTQGFSVLGWVCSFRA